MEGEAQRAWRVPTRQRPQPEPIAQIVQEGVDLVLVIKGAGVAAVVESNALLPPPPSPTGPLQQHGHERLRLRLAHAVGVGREAQDNAPSLPPPPPKIYRWGGNQQCPRSLLGIPQLIDSIF